MFIYEVKQVFQGHYGRQPGAAANDPLRLDHTTTWEYDLNSNMTYTQLDDLSVNYYRDNRMLYANDLQESEFCGEIVVLKE